MRSRDLYFCVSLNQPTEKCSRALTHAVCRAPGAFRAAETSIVSILSVSAYGANRVFLNPGAQLRQSEDVQFFPRAGVSRSLQTAHQDDLSQDATGNDAQPESQPRKAGIIGIRGLTVSFLKASTLLIIANPLLILFFFWTTARTHNPATRGERQGGTDKRRVDQGGPRTPPLLPRKTFYFPSVPLSREGYAALFFANSQQDARTRPHPRLLCIPKLSRRGQQRLSKHGWEGGGRLPRGLQR